MKDVEAVIGNLIDKQSVVYIGSIDAEGYPNTKAMLAPRVREGVRVFYFHTNTSSMRVSQYRRDPKACLYLCDPQRFEGALLCGDMEVLGDDAHKKLLWREGDTMYYPLGVTDPDYCVLRFVAQRGRFYSNFHSVDFEIP